MTVNTEYEGRQQLTREIQGGDSYLQATFLGPQSRCQSPSLSNSPITGTNQPAKTLKNLNSEKTNIPWHEISIES